MSFLGKTKTLEFQFRKACKPHTSLSLLQEGHPSSHPSSAVEPKHIRLSCRAQTKARPAQADGRHHHAHQTESEPRQDFDIQLFNVPQQQ